MNTLTVILAIVAVHRLARLVTSDFIAQPLRDAAIRWDHRHDVKPGETPDDGPQPIGPGAALYLRHLPPGEPDPDLSTEHEDGDPARIGWWEYFTTCDWCVSMWLGIPVAVAAVEWPDDRITIIVFIALAGSALAGLMKWVEEH